MKVRRLMDEGQGEGVDLLQVQLNSWNQGEAIQLETLFEQMASEDSELMLDLLYQEVCRREEDGEEVGSAEYTARFPDLTTEIMALFEVHSAMKRDFDCESTGAKGSPVASFAERYSHLRELGVGGLGRVYLAFDSMLGRHVAIKKLRPELSASRHHEARFQREANLTAKLSHSSVIPIYDLGRDDHGEYFYSMKFIDGQSLDDLTLERKRSRFNWGLHKGDLRRLVIQIIRICDGLKHAHAKGILHRDIKPANILIGECGEVSLVDWGVAGYIVAKPSTADEATYDIMQNQASEETMDTGISTDAWPESGNEESNADRLTLAGMRLGTPAFMSPEQLTSPQAATTLSDLYAVGATLRYALTGNLRENSGVPNQMHDVPDELLTVCDMAMHPSANSRYASLSALQTDLQSWLADEPLIACPEKPLKKVLRWCGAHQKLVLSAATLAIFVFLLSMTFAFQEIRVQDSRNKELAQKALADQQLFQSAVVFIANAEDLNSHAVFRELPIEKNSSKLYEAVHAHFLEMLEKVSSSGKPRVYVHLALSSSRLGHFDDALRYAETGSEGLGLYKDKREHQELILKATLLRAEMQFRKGNYRTACEVADTILEHVDIKQGKFQHYWFALNLTKAVALLADGKRSQGQHFLSSLLQEEESLHLGKKTGQPIRSRVASSTCMARAHFAMYASSVNQVSFEASVFGLSFGPPLPKELRNPNHLLLSPLTEVKDFDPFFGMPSP
ncbi:MAG: serine/threonine-protein kinase [Planctomycetota bacterium]